MRMPLTVAAIRRFGASSSSSRKFFCMSSIGCFERIATPLYDFWPIKAASYPASLSGARGKLSSTVFVSCRHKTSGPAASSHPKSCGIRTLIEFTFQVAIFIQLNIKLFQSTCGRSQSDLKEPSRQNLPIVRIPECSLGQVSPRLNCVPPKTVLFFPTLVRKEVAHRDKYRDQIQRFLHAISTSRPRGDPC